jgi:hypothetical protein
MLKRTKRLVSFPWLLCLAILVSAFDRVPDPPALNHHGPNIKAVCRCHGVQRLVDRGVKQYSYLPTQKLDPQWFTFEHAFDVESPETRRIEIRQAGDPSPPPSDLAV